MHRSQRADEHATTYIPLFRRAKKDDDEITGQPLLLFLLLPCNNTSAEGASFFESRFGLWNGARCRRLTEVTAGTVLRVLSNLGLVRPSRASSAALMCSHDRELASSKPPACKYANAKLAVEMYRS